VFFHLYQCTIYKEIEDEHLETVLFGVFDELLIDLYGEFDEVKKGEPYG
jgi:hypothetical protein